MKKVLSLILAVMLAFACVTVASAEETAEYNVLMLVPYNSGSYFTAGTAGVKALETAYPGTKTEVIEMGALTMEQAGVEAELAAYKDFFLDAAASGKYDLIVTMGAECNAAMVNAAAEYPEQLFFSCDMQDFNGTTLDAEPMNNVYGLMYNTADIGYLAGFVACQVTVSSMPNANEDKKVGVIVGIDFPGLNEYIGSFCQVCAANGVTVFIDYAGDFVADIAPQVAEKATAMYEQGVDVIWQVAGGAGAGVFTAAKAAGRYAFGVDCDQSQTIADAEEAATIVTSFYADYTAAVVGTFGAVIDGTFPGGTYPTVGLAEGFVGYADNAQYEAMTTAEVRESVTALYAELNANPVEIFSVVADPEGWEALKAQVSPAE